MKGNTKSRMENREAIGLIRQMIKDNEEDGGVEFGNKDKEAITLAISALEKQEQDRWHSVAKEGNPKESGAYNCTCSDGTHSRRVATIKYFKRTNEWAMTGRRTFWKVLAWRPLPEPYTEKN